MSQRSFYFSSIYIEGAGAKLSIFFSCVLRKQKKSKARVLTLYQDELIFSLSKGANNWQG